MNPKQPEQRAKRERSAVITVKKLSDIRVGRSKKELKAQMAFSGYIVEHFQMPQYHWRLFLRHSTCWTNVPSKVLRHICNTARSKYHAHLWLHWVAKKRYDKLYAPKPSYIGVSSNSLYSDFMCIHRYEGAWTANTGNGYYGGLQMDLGFQGRYGADYYRLWGTADNWPAPAQVEVAIRAYKSGRGFYPWPNTARACGLL